MLPSEEKQGYFTYDDYYSWNDGKRWELIDGQAYLMEPSPLMTHQGISGNLYVQFFTFLKGRPEKVFAAPFDVRLNADTNDNTVVQTDLIIVRDLLKLADERFCKGAPDMVIEILSPSSIRRDTLVKFNQYLKAGVCEYWIVDPESKTVTIHLLDDGKYTTSAYGEEDDVPVRVLEGCEIKLAEVFAL